MASQQCASVGLLLSLLAAVGISFTLVSRYWQISSQASSQQVNQGISSYAGLWVRCTSYTQGQFQCDKFDESYLGLPASLNTQRAFMVIAAIAVVAGVICSVLGMNSVNVLDDKSKMYSARAGGILILVSGCLTIATASWYATVVMHEYWRDTEAGNAFVYEFGVAMYVAWIAGGVAVISGFLILCCSPRDDKEDAYTYNQPTAYKTTRSPEYV